MESKSWGLIVGIQHLVFKKYNRVKKQKVFFYETYVQGY